MEFHEELTMCINHPGVCQPQPRGYGNGHEYFRFQLGPSIAGPWSITYGHTIDYFGNQWGSVSLNYGRGIFVVDASIVAGDMVPVWGDGDANSLTTEQEIMSHIGEGPSLGWSGTDAGLIFGGGENHVVGNLNNGLKDDLSITRGLYTPGLGITLASYTWNWNNCATFGECLSAIAAPMTGR